MKTGIPVRDAMTHKPVIVTPDLSIGECAGIMKQERIGSLVVQEKGKFLGIFTDRDMTRKIVAQGIPSTKTVGEFMSKNITTITQEKDIHEALMLMRNEHIKHLPVVENDKLLGLITIKDILKLQPDLFDIFAQRYALREQERKLAERTE